jgi:serine/threonine-protein kinase
VADVPVAATVAAAPSPATSPAVSAEAIAPQAQAVPSAEPRSEAARPATGVAATLPLPAAASPRTRAPADGPRARALPTGDTAARDSRNDDSTSRPRAAAPAAIGQVHLAVSPWAEVEVDGADNGITPPVTRLNLPEGTHTITLRNADFAPHTVQVQVSADKPLTVRHRFGQ